MKFYSLFLLGLFTAASLLCNTIHCNNGTESVMNRLTNWYYSPSDNDPRVVGLTIAGGATTVLGALLFKKGIEQTFAPTKQSGNTLTPTNCGKSLVSRAFGSIITVCGAGLALGGVGLLIGNKNIITEFNKIIDGYYNN